MTEFFSPGHKETVSGLSSRFRVLKILTAWSAGETDFLRENWDRMTAAQIAAKLPGRTRNMVIGKARRLRLGKRGAKNTKPYLPRENVYKTPVSTIRSAPIPENSVFIEPKLIDDKSCRWPIGDPKEKGFRFCGCKASAGVSYCVEHARLAFVQPINSGGGNGS